MRDPRFEATSVPGLQGPAWTFSLVSWDSSRQLLGESEVGAQSTPSCQSRPGDGNAGEGQPTPSPFDWETCCSPHPALGSVPAGFKGMVQREDPQPTQSFQGLWCWVQPLGHSHGCRVAL